MESSDGPPVGGEHRMEMEPMINGGIGMVPEIDVGDGERGNGGGRVGS